LTNLNIELNALAVIGTYDHYTIGNGIKSNSVTAFQGFIRDADAAMIDATGSSEMPKHHRDERGGDRCLISTCRRSMRVVEFENDGRNARGVSVRAQSKGGGMSIVEQCARVRIVRSSGDCEAVFFFLCLPKPKTAIQGIVYFFVKQSSDDSANHLVYIVYFFHFDCSTL
jgi:hypothetical protein